MLGIFYDRLLVVETPHMQIQYDRQVKSTSIASIKAQSRNVIMNDILWI